MQPRIHLITLGVSDLERAVRFYRDGLGFPLSSASVAGEVAFFRTGGVVLALWSRTSLAKDANLAPESSGFPGFALAHNARSKEEVDAVLAQAVAAGGRLLKAAKATDWGGYSGYFADPDGFLWEVDWNSFFPFNDDGSLQLPV